MELKDYDQELHAWKIKNVKTPKGSLGNNKEFSVSDECQRIIEILMRPEIRRRFKSKILRACKLFCVSSIFYK